jgi:2-methylcitrate dehydratase PrpD
MDEEMMNLRQRVKTDKTKIETMERTTIEAADEFATLYSRQENTRRLLMVCVVVIIALAVRLGLNGQTVTLKNMYQY